MHVIPSPYMFTLCFPAKSTSVKIFKVGKPQTETKITESAKVMTYSYQKDTKSFESPTKSKISGVRDSQKQVELCNELDKDRLGIKTKKEASDVGTVKSSEILAEEDSLDSDSDDSAKSQPSLEEKSENFMVFKASNTTESKKTLPTLEIQKEKPKESDATNVTETVVKERDFFSITEEFQQASQEEVQRRQSQLEDILAEGTQVIPKKSWRSSLARFYDNVDDEYDVRRSKESFEDSSDPNRTREDIDDVFKPNEEPKVDEKGVKENQAKEEEDIEEIKEHPSKWFPKYKSLDESTKDEGAVNEYQTLQQPAKGSEEDQVVNITDASESSSESDDDYVSLNQRTMKFDVETEYEQLSTSEEPRGFLLSNIQEEEEDDEDNITNVPEKSEKVPEVVETVEITPPGEKDEFPLERQVSQTSITLSPMKDVPQKEPEKEQEDTKPLHIQTFEDNNVFSSNEQPLQIHSEVLVPFSQEMDKTVQIGERETFDEISIETKVTEVKTVTMSLSEFGDVSIEEKTEVHTDTGLTESRSTREKEETTLSKRPLSDNVDTTYPMKTSSPNVSLLAIKPPGGGQMSPIERKTDQPPPHSPSYHRPIKTQEEHVVYPPQPSGGITSLDTSKITQALDENLYIAVTAYEPESDDVLSLHEGEKLELLDASMEDWWMVRKVFDKREGYVPGQYLREKREYEHLVEEQLSKIIERLPHASSKKVINISGKLYGFCTE